MTGDCASAVLILYRLQALILIYEYLQGDNGAGLGASSHTGWAGLAES